MSGSVRRRNGRLSMFAKRVEYGLLEPLIERRTPMPGLGYSHQQIPEQRHALTLSQANVLALHLLESVQAEVDLAIETLIETKILDATLTAGDPETCPLNNEEDGDLAANSIQSEESSDPDYENESLEFFPEHTQADQAPISSNSNADECSPQDFLTASAGFREQVIAQLEQHHLSAEQRAIAMFIVSGLDQRGFFTDNLQESAQACQVSAEEFRSVLAEVQQCEPVGVAARNAWEAIRLALERNDLDDTLECQIACCMGELIETGNFQEIVAQHVSTSQAERAQSLVELARILTLRLGIGESQVMQTLAKILKSIPRPVDEYAEESVPLSNHHVQAVEEGEPDLAVSWGPDGGFFVEFCGRRYDKLKVNRALLDEIDETRLELKRCRAFNNHAAKKLATVLEELESKRDYGLSFIHGWEKRQTLLRVTSVLVDRQVAFLKSGALSELLSFSPEKAGAELGRVEFGGQKFSGSTVSRAIQGKFLRLPDGSRIALKKLCCPGEKASTSEDQAVRYLPEIVKEWINNYVRCENPASPLSDEQIAKAIEHDEDLILSRKTIENYRKELSLPSARERKLKPVRRSSASRELAIPPLPRRCMAQLQNKFGLPPRRKVPNLHPTPIGSESAIADTQTSYLGNESPTLRHISRHQGIGSSAA
jgi:RNA polymerase sigma-54 factor